MNQNSKTCKQSVVIALYPSIPIEKALECVREKLKNDDTLADRTDWKVDDIVQLLSICLETHFLTIEGGYLHKLMEPQSVNQSENH